MPCEHALDGIRVVTIALNLPGPAACLRLREMGAGVTKVEPPSGDPMAVYQVHFYQRLHEGIAVRGMDLKSPAGRAELEALLASADLLITAQRPAALDRLGLGLDSLAARHPRLCVLRITGHAPPRADIAGHDLTYVALHGLLREGALPATLFADMAGAERVVSTALALLRTRDRSGHGAHADVALEDAAAWLAMPLREGLTAPGAMLGGAHPGYHCYPAQDGWIAVAALESHFAQRLAESFGLQELTHAALSERFATRPAAHWERWAAEQDLPIVALRDPPTHPPS